MPKSKFLARTLRVGVCALLTVVAMSSSTRAADWPMFMADPGHSGSNGDAPSVPMALEWKYRTAFYQNNTASPIVAGATVYFTSQSSVYALNSETGELIWKYPEEGPIGTAGAATIKATPAYWDGTLFVGATDGVLYALNATDGVLLWQFDTLKSIRFAPIVVDGVVYVGSDDDRLYAIDGKTGKPAFAPVRTGGDVIGSPAYSDNVLYVTSSDLQLYAITTTTGRVKYRYRTMNPNSYASVVATDRYNYIVGGNVLYALSRAGVERWKYSARNPITTTPLVTEDGVYFGDRGGRLYALDARGRPKWTITDNKSRETITSRASVREASKDVTDPFLQLTGSIYSSPVLIGKNIVIGTNRGFLYAVNAETGKIEWDYAVFSNLPAGAYPNINSAVAVGNGRLFFQSDDGALHCFSPTALDATKPVVSSETPTRATEMNGTPPIMIGAVLSDEGSGINSSTIVLDLDGEPVEHIYQPNTGWVYYRTKSSQPVEPLSDGRHTVTLRASDWKGNTVDQSWTFVINNRLAPTVINVPTDGTTPAVTG